MSFILGDATASVQRLAVSNGGAVELGSSTPSTSLSVNGREFFDGTYLTPYSIPPDGLMRITGSVLLHSLSDTIVTVGPCVGMGIMPGAFLLNFTSTTFDAAYPDNTTAQSETFSYSVF